MATRWQEAAACRDEDTELFFPPGNGPGFARQIAAAKRICARCPVSEQCADQALNTPEKYGIWAGLTEEDRVIERRRMQRQASARRMRAAS